METPSNAASRSVVLGSGRVHGKQGFFQKYCKPALIVLILLAVLGATVAVIEYFRYRSRAAPLDLRHSKA